MSAAADIRRRRATLFHLLDLKRAGHSPRRTEFTIPADGITRRINRPLAPDVALLGSSAASLLE